MGLLAPVAFAYYYLQMRGRRPLGSVWSIGQMIAKRGNLITAFIIIGMIGWVVFDNVYKEAASSAAANNAGPNCVNDQLEEQKYG